MKRIYLVIVLFVLMLGSNIVMAKFDGCSSSCERIANRQLQQCYSFCTYYGIDCSPCIEQYYSFYCQCVASNCDNNIPLCDGIIN